MNITIKTEPGSRRKYKKLRLDNMGVDELMRILEDPCTPEGIKSQILDLISDPDNYEERT